MAGGKKLPSLRRSPWPTTPSSRAPRASTWAANIFQSDAPQAMISAVHAVVHKNLKPADGLEMFKALKGKK